MSKFIKHPDLRFKLLAANIASILIPGLLIIILVKTIYSERLLDQLQKTGLYLAKALAREATDYILTRDDLILQVLVNDYKANTEDIEYIFILNEKGEALAHTFEGGFPADLKEINIIGKDEEFKIETISIEGKHIYDMVVPVLKGEAGVVHIGFSKQPILRDISRIVGLVEIIIIVMLIVAIILFSILGSRLTKPIRRLTKIIRQIGRGEFKQRIQIKGSDEIGELSRAFNTTMDGLNKSHGIIQQKNEQMLALNRQLQKANLELEEWTNVLEQRVEDRTKKIQVTQQLLKEVTDGIEEGIMLLSRDFQILWANKKIYDLTGLKEGEIIGNHCYRITHHLEEPCKAPYDICPVYEVLKTGKLVSVIHTHFDKAGKEFYAEVTAYPIRDAEGNVIQFVHLVRDVTERIRAERELEEAYRKLKSTQAQLIQSAKMASVGQLAAGLAHEINNPLTGVLNNAQLIKMQIEQGVDSSILEFKEIIDVIEESALRCKNITKSLLDFSRAPKASIQPLSINKAIENVVNLIEHELRLENITIQKELQASLPPVRGNSQLLQEVFMNIIVNARWAIQKKSKKEGGFITIKTQYYTGEGRVNIFVSDTGVGISDEALNKIFDPFFTTKEIGEGTGLGLSVVYGIIKEHQGTIEVESQLSKGTTFKISLPVVKESTNQKVTQ